LVVAVLVFRSIDWNRSSLPGKDLSALEAGAVPRHIEALKSPDAAARKQAAIDLWQIGDAAKDATPILLQTAKDANPEVREAAVKALGRTGQENQDALTVVLDALQDDRAEVRAAAATSLAEAWRVAGKGRSGGGRAQPGRGGIGRGNATGVPGPRILTAAYEPLARKAIPLLTAALRDADPRVRAHAAEALAETGPLAEPAVSDLVHILQNDQDETARLQATLALHNIGPGAKAAVPVLVEHLRTEKVGGVRVNTAAALGMIRANPETVVPALVVTFLTDEHPDARRCAMASIGQFGPDAKYALPLLREAAKDPKNQQSPATMKSINSLIAFIGPEPQESGKAPTGKDPSSSQRPPSK
jgi:HEAT repeat protein